MKSILLIAATLFLQSCLTEPNFNNHANLTLFSALINDKVVLKERFAGDLNSPDSIKIESISLLCNTFRLNIDDTVMTIGATPRMIVFKESEFTVLTSPIKIGKWNSAEFIVRKFNAEEELLYKKHPDLIEFAKSDRITVLIKGHYFVYDQAFPFESRISPSINAMFNSDQAMEIMDKQFFDVTLTFNGLLLFTNENRLLIQWIRSISRYWLQKFLHRCS